MATPTRLSLLSPFRIWLTINLLFLVLLVSAGIGISQISRRQSQRLIDAQRETLTHARLGDLDAGNYRAFVEGIGKEFREIYVSISTKKASETTTLLHYGLRTTPNVCSGSTLSQAQGHGDLLIEMCRPYSSPVIPLSILIGVFALLSLVLLRLLLRLEQRSLGSFVEFLNEAGVALPAKTGLVGILSNIRSIKQELDSTRAKAIEQAKMDAKFELALKLAHDIRGPIEVFEDRVNDMPNIPSDARRIIRDVAFRVQHVANDLLTAYRSSSEVSAEIEIKNSSKSELIETATLLQSLSEICDEKRVQNRSRAGIKILFEEPKDLPRFDLELSPAEMKCVLANIIENSIQAIETSGTVSLRVHYDSGLVKIGVSDTGKGIPADLIPQLAFKGATFGKKNGNGLGLYQAKQFAEGLGGTLSIDSKEGIGTSISLSLPASHHFEHPDLILIDNDSAVRLSWKVGAKQRNKILMAYASPEEFYRISNSIDTTTPIYVDLDLGDHDGREVARELIERQFSNVYIASGYREAISPFPGLRGIVGKAFPS